MTDIFSIRLQTTTIELENKADNMLRRSYSAFAEKKEQAYKAMQKKYENTVKEINRLEGVVEQQRRWNRERNIRMAESKLKSIERLEETLEKPERDTDAIRFTFTASERSGNDVLSVTEVAKHFGEKKLFENVSFEVKRGERVFLLGANGCGKSTLYKIIKGVIKPDCGSVHFRNKSRMCVL